MDELFPYEIPVFSWSDLHGKTVKIMVFRGIEGEVVIGVDENADKVYILDTKIFA